MDSTLVLTERHRTRCPTTKQGMRLLTRLTTCILLATYPLIGGASVTADDPFTTLIKERIEAFSDASSKGDQAGMNRLLDDDVLFSSGNGTVDHDAQRDKSDATAALLKEQTQTFLDASLRRDMVVMRKYLGDEVIFVSEDGVVSGKSEILNGANVIFPKSDSSSVKVTDWVLHYSGEVAVASFVGELMMKDDKQTRSYKFLGVITWTKFDKEWKLIASHSIPLYQDPSPIVLTPEAWNEYVGTYSGGPSLTVRVSRDGSKLTVSTNGGKPVDYYAEARDVFFHPGSDSGSLRSRLAFQRDKNGRIEGYESNRGLVLRRSEAVAAETDHVDVQTGISTIVLPAAELVVHRSGDVAVATFIHERVTHYYGQVIHTKYRSTETWIKRGAEWKMLTLQSRELERPSAATAGPGAY